MLKINNLHANIGEKEILKGINLEIKAGEIHAIMGPNGSGKSTLSAVLAGREEYEVTEGSVDFEGKDLLDLNPENIDDCNDRINACKQFKLDSAAPALAAANKRITNILKKSTEDIPEKVMLGLLKKDHEKNLFVTSSSHNDKPIGCFCTV